MTIEDLQELLKAGDATITYLGPWSVTTVGSLERSVHIKYVCLIGPAKTSNRWSTGAWTMRGNGATMLEAIEEALTKLAAFVFKYQPDDR